MGQVAIHAGVLRREHEYYGSQTLLPGKLFLSNRMVNPIAAYLHPYNDQGLGSPTSVLSVDQAISTGALVGVDFEYYINMSTKERYFITCNSADFFAAFESTDAHNEVNLVVATGSGYTIKG